MKLISWNVNGLRACMQKGFLDFFYSANADFFCLQETKLQEGQISLELPGYQQYWCYAEKKGYSGTAIFTKHTPLSVSYGLGVPEMDTEGRLITLEYPEFYLVTCYTPNAQRELARIDHRMRWDEAFRNYISALDAKKPVIICGDLNVAHKEIDLKNPSSNRGSAGFSDQERESFTKTLSMGFTDTFRHLHPDTVGAYTWWSYMFHARQNNAGWRIDYFLVSDRQKESVYKTPIYSDVLGSDHCPVGLEIDMLCNGGICWPEDPQQKPSDDENEQISNKSSGVKAAAAVISAVMVLFLCLLFPKTQQEPVPTETQTPTYVLSTVPIAYDTPQILPVNPVDSSLNLTVIDEMLSPHFVLSSPVSSALMLGGFSSENYRFDIEPTFFSYIGEPNLWIYVEPEERQMVEDYTLSEITLTYSSSIPDLPDLHVVKAMDDEGYTGWLIYGTIDKEKLIAFGLFGDNGTIQEIRTLRVSPLSAEEDGVT